MKFIYLYYITILILSSINIYSKENTFLIGVQDFEDYLPYSQYRNNEFTGFERELLDLFAKTMNYKFLYVPRPLKRLYSEYLQGKFDFKIPDNEYWSADIKKGYNIRYSLPIVKYIDGVMVKENNINNGIDKLKYLGIIRGFTPLLYLEKIKKGEIILIETDNIAGLLEQLEKGRIDGAYINISVAQYYLRNYYKNFKLIFNKNLPYIQSTRHLSSIKYPEIIEEFNNFLIKESNTINKLIKKYNIENDLK